MAFRQFFVQKSGVLCVFLVLVIAGASYVVYPLADARRDQGAGSTADDGIIQAAHAFFSGDGLYSQRILGNIPISAGPGWVILNLPLENSPLFWMLSPLYILLSLVIAAKSVGSIYPAAIVLCLVSSSLLFWELLVTGHDIVAIGFAFAGLIMIAWRLAHDPNAGVFKPMTFGIIVGMIATSRLVFAALPLLLALFACKTNRRQAFLIGGVGTLVTAVLHAYFYFTSDFYQPLHLLGRGRHTVGPCLMILGLIGESLVGVCAYRQLTSHLTTWLYGAWLCLMVPLVFISLGELHTVGWEFAKWEGANYIFPCTPCYLFYLAAKMSTGSLSQTAETNP